LAIIFPEFEDFFANENEENSSESTPIRSITLGYASEHLKKFLIAMEK